ncbi:CACTA en-spm transposon protein [Cucumis melo var. makuwa]|uniref:CACTA en-spm transposon protein n=1 Tax=Cucumis melo var. makuwa TaxID=1194695 RepID=A0A5A7TUC4_CUCMM|nr:CACTA en-spm transposon protein [Cucumis melo var. makuwa]
MADLQRFFVLDFNDQAINRYFKKYSDPEEARANPPNLLVGLMMISTFFVTST